MTQTTVKVQECIDACVECASVCNETLAHCLQEGGRHVEPSHIKLLIGCAEICQVSGNFMLRGSPLSRQVCQVCAEVCERCAESCGGFNGDNQMRRCAEMCRKCAEICQQMSG